MSTKTQFAISICATMVVIVSQIIYFSIIRTTNIKIWIGVVLELMLIVLTFWYARKSNYTINKIYLFAVFGSLVVFGIIFALAFTISLGQF